MSDDGVGVRVVQLLQERYRFPEKVTLLDGGTLGLDLLPKLEGVERLLVVDAVKPAAHPELCSGFPATISRWRWRQRCPLTRWGSRIC